MSGLVLRPGKRDDARRCGAICYEAFRTISGAHGFPPDFPSVRAAVGVMSPRLEQPGVWSAVAELDGRIVGSNFMSEADAIAGIGPITVDPEVQNAQIGRRLMEAALERAAGQGKPGVRLVQAAFHNRSLSLYAKLGFEVREPLSNLQGPPIGEEIPGLRVRPAVAGDLAACNALCRGVHGHDRSEEVRGAIEQSSASVVERGGSITGYATAVGFFGHAVARTNLDLEALIAAAPSFPGPGFLLPSRNTEVLRWCLERGLRVVQPLTLMSLGLYNEPAGAFLPSILY